MELEDFLNYQNLSQYYRVFIENGVEDLDILQELTENHLERLGVKIGHIIKIRKAVQKFQNEGLPTCQHVKLRTSSLDWTTEKVLKTTSLKVTKPKESLFSIS